MRSTLLVVDDEVYVRESLRKLLQAEDYEVILAADGKEAVDKFRVDPAHFGLVLTDLNMPIRNGWASVDRLLELSPLLPIVVLTGMSNQRELAENSGVSALVEKPIDVPKFLDLLQDLLANSQRGACNGPPAPHPPFHYLCSSRSSNEQPVDPYAHWGLNE